MDRENARKGRWGWARRTVSKGGREGDGNRSGWQGAPIPREECVKGQQGSHVAKGLKRMRR